MISTEIGASVGSVGARMQGNAIEVRKPKEACLALEMLAYGAPYREITEATGLRAASITALRGRHGEAIAIRRQRAADEGEELAATYLEVLRAKADRVLSDEGALDKLNPKDAALTYGILTDKGMLLRGDPTSITESRKGVSLQDALEEINAAKESVRLKRVGEAVDV